MPLSLVLFVTAEVILAIFYRLLAYHDNIVNHSATYFSVNHKTYWNVLGLLLLAYSIILIV